MKIYLVPLIAILIILCACNRNVEQQKFVYKIDSLNTELNTKDSTINDLLFFFNEIQLNLNSVAIMQGIISTEVEKGRSELSGNTKKRINSNIAAINDLMTQNRKIIENLNRNFKRQTLKISQLKKMIINLNETITQKNMELQSLNEKLHSVNAQVHSVNAEVAQLKISVDTLSSINSSQSQIIASQEEAIHTAYYLVGKLKDLKRMKIIDNTGGLFGIGKTTKLNSDIDNASFIRIDYTKTLSIPINSKKAKVITAHPPDSYLMDKENGEFTNLRITQPNKFWSASRYLAVLKDY